MLWPHKYKVGHIDLISEISEISPEFPYVSHTPSIEKVFPHGIRCL